MNKIQHIQRITQKELQSLTSLKASWHYDYRDSAFVFVGGLNYSINEGDLVTILSQFGEIVDCRLARDKKTGKSQGFAFVAYEDQLSTVLAVDNLNGVQICGRPLMVDHVKQYKIPRQHMYISDENSEEHQSEDQDSQKE